MRRWLIREGPGGGLSRARAEPDNLPLLWINAATLLLHNATSLLRIKMVVKVGLQFSYLLFQGCNLSVNFLQLSQLGYVVGKQFHQCRHSGDRQNAVDCQPNTRFCGQSRVGVLTPALTGPANPTSRRGSRLQGRPRGLKCMHRTKISSDRGQTRI